MSDNACSVGHNQTCLLMKCAIYIANFANFQAMSGVPEKPVNRSKALPFRDLVQYLLQPLQDYTRRPGIKGRSGAVAPAELKRAAIAKFVARWRKEVGDDVFPVFRLCKLACDMHSVFREAD